MADISQTITLYSGAIPNRNTMDLAAFDAAATAWADWQEDLPGQINTWATQANALRAEINGWRAEVDADTVATQSALNAALTAVGATLYPVGAPYSEGDCCIGSNGHTYRSLVDANSADPVGDGTGAYLRLTTGGDYAKLFFFGGR